MNENRKRQISEFLRKKKNDTGMSDRQLANQISNISESTINNIINFRWSLEGKDQLVSDETFQRVAAFLNMDEEWVVHTKDINYLKVQFYCNEARCKSESYAISAPPGMSKTEAARAYANRQDVFYVQCQEHYTKRVFLQKILQAMGLERNAATISELIDRIIEALNKKNKPLIILDEADKLSDKLFQFFITFYNETLKNCGFVFLGSVFFEKRVRKGVLNNKQGYAEFFSRIGREFIHLRDLDKKRITDICKLNGISDPSMIMEVINTSDNDMRHVKRKIEDMKRKNSIGLTHQVQTTAAA